MSTSFLYAIDLPYDEIMQSNEIVINDESISEIAEVFYGFMSHPSDFEKRVFADSCNSKRYLIFFKSNVHEDQYDDNFGLVLKDLKISGKLIEMSKEELMNLLCTSTDKIEQLDVSKYRIKEIAKYY